MHPSAIPSLLLVLVARVLCAADGADRPSGFPDGIPLNRTYAFDDIPGASPGAHLDFDSIGRLAVVGSGSYAVLNDSAWLERLGPESPVSSVLHAQTDGRGNTFFGALANWGLLEPDGRGGLVPISLRPESVPAWVESTSFVRILVRERTVYFSGLNGIVAVDIATKRHQFFACTGNSVIFVVNGRVFVSAKLHGIHYLDEVNGSVVRVPGSVFESIEVDGVAELDPTRVLISTVDRRLLLFDGHSLADWGGVLKGSLPGRAPAMERLPEGDLAIGVTGVGLFILSPEGSLKLALTHAEYHRIHDLEAREPGVLWIATETAVQKLLYGGPVSAVDQRMGLPVSWPHAVDWDRNLVVASGGFIYWKVPSADGYSSVFKPVPGQPEHGGSAIASHGRHLLVGNRSGVFRYDGSRFIQVMSGIDATQLVMTEAGVCYVLGERQFAALRLTGDAWIEAAQRIPSGGFPAVVHAAGTSAWIEYGSNRVARIWLEDGTLRTEVFEASRPGNGWTNVGYVGDIVTLISGTGEVNYFDERTGARCAAPEIDALLRSAPFPILRLASMPSGWIWATHENGVFLVRPDPSQPSGFAFDTASTADLRVFQPMVQILGPDRAAVTSARSFHVVSRQGAATRRDATPPMLVSIIDRRSGTPIGDSGPTGQMPAASLPYSSNNLLFRFFSGSYAALRPPEYEYTLAGGSSDWTSRGTDSHLDLRDLSEGAYRLTVRLLDGTGSPPPPLVIGFTLAPPWYRSTVARLGYAAVVLAGLWLLPAWVVQRTRRRNAYLENLVGERTADLRAAMSRLADESRATAILTERNRLAGEIHDSVQQGLSGLLLQLGAVLRLADLLPDVRSKLEVAHKMVSFTRHEVQQAVWNLESPFLEGAELPEALRRMCRLIGTGPQTIELNEIGSCPPLAASVKHQLLRIAQEAITNAVRHADSQSIQVTVETGPDQLILKVCDEGRGFDPDRTLSGSIGHFGLRGMRARAARINGTFELHSGPGRGTQLRVVLPLHATSLSDHANHSESSPNHHTHPDR